MPPEKWQHGFLEIRFQEFSVKQNKSNGILVENTFFKSNVLTYFLQENDILFGYSIHPRDMNRTSISYEDMDDAEKFLLKSLQNQMKNPKCINPGIIFDWTIKDAEQLIKLLQLQTVTYNHKNNKILPLQTKIGFVFDAPPNYLNNCEFCNQMNCSYRKHAFNDMFNKIVHAN